MSGNREHLFDELEREARYRSWSLENMARVPNGFTAQHYPLTTRERRELRRLNAALNASTDVDTFIALCKGEPVPARRLSRDLINYHHTRARR